MTETKQNEVKAPVHIEKLVYGGEGLARLDGQVVLVPFVLPGEEVSVETKRVKNGLLRAVSADIVSPSPDRIVPRCPYFGNCGGCHYQHAAYETQLNAKRDILLETLARLAHITFAREVNLISGEPWQYRNRVQLHFADDQVGYHRAGSHELCPIDHCPISSPKLNEAIGSLAKAVKQREWPRFLKSLELFTNETGVQINIVESTRPVAARFFEWCRTFIPGISEAALIYTTASGEFRIGRNSFFQVNRFLVDALVEAAIGEAKGQRALDLYAGVGLFTLPLARRFAEVEAVERGGSAFRDMKWNVREHEEQVKVVRDSTEPFLKSQSAPADLIVADPPRSGLGKEVTTELLRLQAPELVIVSCDPATLARDLKSLCTVYDVHQLSLIDLFPQTFHFETIARLRLR